MKKFLGLLVALVLVVGLGVGIYFLASPNQEASAVMTLQTNPEIQLVLDQNNKVMSVNAVNEDGESLILNVNFVGKTAEEAAKLFAEASTNYGKVGLQTTNGEINVTIACDDATSAKYTELKTKVTNKVNDYFKEIGVMAGAVVNVTENIQAEIEKLGYQISDYVNKTYAEIMADVETKSKELKNVALANRDQIFTKLSQLKTEFSEMFNLEDTITSLKAQINDYKTQIATKKEELKTANEFEKIAINAALDAAETALDTVEKSLNTAEKSYKEFKSEYEAKLDAFIKDLRQKSEAALETAKARLQEVKTEVNNHINEFKNKEESVRNQIIADIEAYQNSLNA